MCSLLYAAIKYRVYGVPGVPAYLFWRVDGWMDDTLVAQETMFFDDFSKMNHSFSWMCRVLLRFCPNIPSTIKGKVRLATADKRWGAVGGGFIADKRWQERGGGGGGWANRLLSILKNNSRWRVAWKHETKKLLQNMTNCVDFSEYGCPFADRSRHVFSSKPLFLEICVGCLIF